MRSIQVSQPQLRLELVGYFDPATPQQIDRPDLELHSYRSLEDLIKESPDLLFVSTPHDAVMDTCRIALTAGVRVHVEKPLGRNLSESQQLHDLDTNRESLTIGFNYRFFRGVEQFLLDIKNGLFGDVISVEMTLAHGGSPSDQSSWKLDPIYAGGGSLLDPGVHLLDLCLQIAPDLQLLNATNWKGFWNTGIEEEVGVTFKSKHIPSIVLKSSIVRWRSEFSLRVNGTDGYGHVQGRGRSYGIQTYVRGNRWGWANGVSQIDSEELVCTDPCTDSFLREMTQLLLPSSFSPKVATSADGLLVMSFVDEIYSMMNNSVA